MDKINEALSKLVKPEDLKEVTTVIDELLAETKAGLEAEYNKKLEEAYGQLTEELKKAEGVAEQGYQQAFGIIQDLRNRLETQKAEFEAALDEGYEEAYQMLKTEQTKNESLATELYQEYDKKLGEIKEFMIDKIDAFLQFKGKEIAEQVRRDILNDPRMVEHRLTLNKIVETVSDYMSAEDFGQVENGKVESLTQEVAQLKAGKQLLESRCIQLSTQNTKLNEAVRHNQEVLKENTVVSQKERAAKAQNAQASGKKVVSENVEVIGEHKGEEPVTTEAKDTTLVDTLKPGTLQEWGTLAGIKPSKK